MIVEVKGTVEGIERLPFEVQVACIIHRVHSHSLLRCQLKGVPHSYRQSLNGRRMLLPQLAPIGGIDILRAAAVGELNSDRMAEIVVVDFRQSLVSVLCEIACVRRVVSYHKKMWEVSRVGMSINWCMYMIGRLYFYQTSQLQLRGNSKDNHF